MYINSALVYNPVIAVFIANRYIGKYFLLISINRNIFFKILLKLCARQAGA